MGITDSLKAAVGIASKAVLIIGDFSEIQIVQGPAPRPSAGTTNGLGQMADIGSFDADAVKSFAENVTGIAGLDRPFEFTGNAKKYRFEFLFNPEEIYINGYGGEELPIQTYGSNGQPNNQAVPELNPDEELDGLTGQTPGSHMAAADTRIEMSFKVVFDKTDPQDAFYSDKFTPNIVSIGKGIAKAGLKAAGKKNNSVQPEVEALTACVRDPKKRLALFTWGDMSYQGVINSVNAEYVMFNVNGEPCRANVSINMVLYDEADMAASLKLWKREYMKSFGQFQNGVAQAQAAGLGD